MLWNILLGDMSLVGPRPEPEPYTRALTEIIPFYPQRCTVKPGLTGWAQINSRPVSEPEDALIRFEFDLYYVKNLSAALDMYLVLYTLRTLLFSGKEYAAFATHT